MIKNKIIRFLLRFQGFYVHKVMHVFFWSSFEEALSFWESAFIISTEVLLPSFDVKEYWAFPSVHFLLLRVLHKALHFIIRPLLFLAGENNFMIYCSLSFGLETYEMELKVPLENVKAILYFLEVRLRLIFLEAVNFIYRFFAA